MSNAFGSSNAFRSRNVFRSRPPLVVAAVLLCGLVSYGLFAAAAAEASLPGRNGVIGFGERGRTCCSVAIVTPSGRGYRGLPLRGANQGDPAYSPDGTRLAFSTDESAFTPEVPPGAVAGPTLQLAGPVGTDQGRVPGPIRGTDPTWSPTRRELAFRRLGPSGPPLGLGVVGIDGQGGRDPTAEAADGAPAFSSRGEIAFVRGGDLYVVGASGAGPRRVTRSPAFIEQTPDFSPDGRWLVFSSGRSARGAGRDIFTMSARGGPARRLLRSTSDDHDPVWSPDGRLIAFAFNNPVHLSGIGLVGTNGRGYRTIQTGRPTNRFDFRSLTWQPRR